MKFYACAFCFGIWLLCRWIFGEDGPPSAILLGIIGVSVDILVWKFDWLVEQWQWRMWRRQMRREMRENPYNL